MALETSSPGLGQAQQRDRVKQVNEIPILPLVIIGSLMLIQVYTNNRKTCTDSVHSKSPHTMTKMNNKIKHGQYNSRVDDCS